MWKFSNWLSAAAVGLALIVSGCGGGAGSSAAPPTGFTVTPGNGQVVITWQGSAGVDYWLMYAATASAIDMKNPPAGRVWVTSLSSPYVVSGLTNGVSYAFAMNGRSSGGPGGAQTASQSAIPHAAGRNWTAGTGAAGSLNGLTYGTSGADNLAYLVAVGDTGAIYKAADGVSQSIAGYTWNAVTTGPVLDFKAATYGYSRYVAVGSGSSNNITSSTDLSTWTPATYTAGTSAAGLNAVASNGATLVAVGNSGTIFYSTNALNWTAASVPGTVTSNLLGVAYSSANGLWVAVGAGGAVLTSSDAGVSWSAVTSPAGGNALNSVAVTSGNVFVAVGAGGVVVRSTDGANWALQTPGPATTLYAVSTDSTQFIAVGAGGQAYTSLDGIAWTAAITGTTADLKGVLGSSSKYVAVGQVGTTLSSIN